MSEEWDGRPQNPERDGWHWLQHPEDLRPIATPWIAGIQAWSSGAAHSPQGVVDLGWTYLGPCLTPAEVAAREAAAALDDGRVAATLEALADDRTPICCDGRDCGCMGSTRHDEAAHHMPKTADALARLLAEAEARGAAKEREACAQWHDEQAAFHAGKEEELLGEHRFMTAQRARENANAHRSYAAAIRARKE